MKTSLGYRFARWARYAGAALGLASMLLVAGCGVSVQYSMSGTSTAAETITILEFYNNTDLGPANMGPTFTNQLKNYFIQNSNIAIVQQDGQLQLEGEITDFRVTPIAPTGSGDPNDLGRASSTRLTINVKATYVNTLEPELGFKDKTFSFYKDFSNDQNITDVEEAYTKQIFERIVNDIFNASVANW